MKPDKKGDDPRKIQKVVDKCVPTFLALEDMQRFLARAILTVIDLLGQSCLSSWANLFFL